MHNGMTKSVAREVGTEGITVNSICPGLILTDIVMDTGPATAEAMGITFDQMADMFVADSAIGRGPMRFMKLQNLLFYSRAKLARELQANKSVSMEAPPNINYLVSIRLNINPVLQTLPLKINK